MSLGDNALMAPMQDHALAEHVVTVHRDGKAPEKNAYDQEILSSELLRGYIAAAKTYDPVVPESLTGWNLCLLQIAFWLFANFYIEQRHFSCMGMAKSKACINDYT